jgi:septum formation protein
MRLILASASPRRAELLRAAGYSFDVCAPDVDERALPGEPPVEYVRRVADAKASRIAETAGPAAVVLAADTAVVVDEQILGKPRDAHDAARMLALLSGRAHEVMTGVALYTAEQRVSFVETTAVHVVALSEEDLDWYVASGEGSDKAGAYAIQGLASRFIPRIDGSYSNVVGLPIATVSRMLRSAGFGVARGGNG